jgi:hypothetical protein
LSRSSPAHDPHQVAQLLNEGRLERVTADVTAAWTRIDEAKKHLDSSAALAATDPSLAYVGLYDAARKAIVAHMQANGYRATNRTGAHQAVGLYAEATITTGTAKTHIDAFDRLRQIRNRTEYGNQVIGEQMLTADLEHARQIVAAVEAALPPRVTT